jgi:chromate reductase
MKTTDLAPAGDREPAGPCRVLAIAGSLRRESFNRRLLLAAAARAPGGVEVRLYQGLGELPLLNEDTESQAFEAGPVRELCTLVREADALLMATPEYNHSIPGVLKNAVDWLSRPAAGAALAGKPVALVGASAGSWGTRLAQAALRQALFAAESSVITAPALYVAQAHRVFDARGALTDESIGRTLREVLETLARARGVPRAQVDFAAR